MSESSINPVFGSHSLDEKIFYNRCVVSMSTIVAILALATIVAGALAIAASLNNINIQDLAHLDWKVGTGMVAGGVGTGVVLGIGNAVYFKVTKMPGVEGLETGDLDILSDSEIFDDEQ